jgi:hypothetical protein
MLQELMTPVLGEALAKVIFETARFLGLERQDRRHNDRIVDLDRDLVLATWFDTYKLTEDDDVPQAVLAGLAPDVLKAALGLDRCHAILHELLAARLTDAPELQVNRLQEAFVRLLRTTVPAANDDLPAVVFDYFDRQICELCGRLAGNAPDVAEKLRERAVGTRIIAILDAIERHLEAYARDFDPEADAGYHTRYRRHIADEFGKLSPPDFERRRRIPLDELYVPPSIAPADDVLARDHYPSYAAQPLLADFAAQIDRAVLLGDPGAGKTTATRALMHRNVAPQYPTPFLVILRDFAADQNRQLSVADFIAHTMKTRYQCEPPSGWVRRQLLDGAALVIFDGLDELMDPSRRADVAGVIEHFCAEYPLARVLVTSRFVGYDQAALDESQFSCSRIAPFDDEQVHEYARKWFACDSTLGPGRSEQYADAFNAESASVPDLRSNPLLLSLMCILYRGEGYIPQQRAEIYKRCASLMFHQWDASRHIHVDLTLSHAQVERALRHLAHWFYTRDDPSAAATTRELVREITGVLHPRAFEEIEDAEAAAAQFVEFCRVRAWVLAEVGTSARGDSLYTFAHRTFLEYFAAVHLAATTDTPEQLAQVLLPKVAAGEWEVVGVLAVAMKDAAIDRGGERCLDVLLEDQSPVHEPKLLSFAAACLESTGVSPQWIRALARRTVHRVDADMKITTVGISTTRQGPLTALRRLLAPSSSHHDVITAEMTAYCETLVASAHLTHRLRGYALAGPLLSHVAMTHGEQWSIEQFDRWAPQVLEDAALHPYALYIAIERGFIDAAHALALPDGVRVLLGDHVVDRHVDRSMLFRAAYDIWDSRMADEGALLECGELGRHLLATCPTPPWTWPTTGGWFQQPLLIWDGSAGRRAPDDTGDEGLRLALAVIAAVEFESEERRGVPVRSREVFDRSRERGLEEFAPYFLLRLGELNPPLNSLPIREDYQRLFEAWARHEVDFTDPRLGDDDEAATDSVPAPRPRPVDGSVTA